MPFPPASFHIRPGVPEDARAIATIQVACWRQAYAGILEQRYLDNLSVGEKEAFWRHAIGNPLFGEVKVAAQVGEVIGFASYGPARITAGADREIYTLYVAADQQRRGVGRRLALAAQKPGGVMEARTAEGNPFAKFYESLGGWIVRRDVIPLGGKNYPLVCYQWLAV